MANGKMDRLPALRRTQHQPALCARTTQTVLPLLSELDTPLLRSMRIGYLNVGTLEALRTAALIREELEQRGEVLQ